MLRRLNAAGYGVEGSRLELNLVSNPVGAFLPANQAQAEAKFRRDLLRKWGVTFDNLYTFGNVPLGASGGGSRNRGNDDRYLRTLANGFNPCTVEGLMCRTQVVRLVGRVPVRLRFQSGGGSVPGRTEDARFGNSPVAPPRDTDCGRGLLLRLHGGFRLHLRGRGTGPGRGRTPKRTGVPGTIQGNGFPIGRFI